MLSLRILHNGPIVPLPHLNLNDDNQPELPLIRSSQQLHLQQQQQRRQQQQQQPGEVLSRVRDSVPGNSREVLQRLRGKEALFVLKVLTTGGK